VRVAVGWSMAAVLVVIGAAGTSRGQQYADYGSNGTAGSPILEVWKQQRRMELRQGDRMLREFRVVLGTDPRFAKQYRGDNRTPVGRYYISEKHVSQYHRFLGLSYPNVDDAERGYSRGLIDAGEWADVFLANLSGGAPPWRTPLGGRVGIHGFGDRPFLTVDWTEGCIAVRNEDIEYLYDVVPVGTAVVINE